MSTERDIVRDGVIAIVKSVVVVAGVPIAGERLWFTQSNAQQIEHVVLAIVGILWALTTINLCHDILVSVRHDSPSPERSWSSGWARAIAGLLLLAFAGSLSSSRSHPLEEITATAVASPTSAAMPFTLGKYRDQHVPPTIEQLDYGSSLMPELAILGLGLVTSAALARRTRHLRRASEVLRRPGETVSSRQPTTAAAAVEMTISQLAEDQLLDWVDVVNRLLTSALSTRERLTIKVIRVDIDGVEVIFSDPPPKASAPFRTVTSQNTWMLDRCHDLAELQARVRGVAASCPGLLPVGDDEYSSYFVAIGPRRSLGIEGQTNEIQPVLNGLLIAFRTISWTEEADVELIELPLPEIGEACHHLHRSSPIMLGDFVQQHIDREPSPGGRERLVFIGNTVMNAEMRAHLFALSNSVGIVAPGFPGTERLVVKGGRATLASLGVDMAIAAPTRLQFTTVGEVLADACAPPRMPDIIEIGQRYAPLERGRTEILLLATTLQIDGVAEMPTDRDSERLIEFIAQLALHGYQSTEGDLIAQMLPTVPPEAARSIIRRWLSLAQHLLGMDDNGRQLVTINTEGTISLNLSVTCDWLRFSALTANAVRSAPERAAMHLHTALALIGDRPRCALQGGPHWMVATGLSCKITATVIDSAHQLAQLSLARGDLDTASWAISTGLRLEPVSEMLARDQMVCAERANDLPRVRQIFADLERSLADLGGNEPSVESSALLHALIHPDGLAADRVV